MTLSLGWGRDTNSLCEGGADRAACVWTGVPDRAVGRSTSAHERPRI